MKTATTLTEIPQEEMFTEYLQLQQYTPDTREGILKNVRRFVQWAEKENIPVEQVSYNDVTAYVAHRKKAAVKPVSIQKEVTTIKHYYTFLLSINEMQDNPCSNVEIHGIKRKTLYETFSTEELDSIYKTFAGKSLSASGIGSHITHKRNKVILGLIIYQGIRVHELGELKLKNLNLQQGKIEIESAARTEGRELKLEAHQVFEMMDYVNETRKMILALTGKQTDKLFTSIGASDRFSNVMQKMVKELIKQNGKIKDIKQLRASVITNWLKQYDIRKVQYMAGHRYISSTESYQVNNMDDLKEDVNRYHPNF